MLDIIIRNGRIVDGSGLPAFRGDIGIADGRLCQVGGHVAAQARCEIDAASRVVAPGFIDPHTHFDVQLLWDGAAKPALEHGVTCVVPGNCSLSLAPLRASDRKAVVGMFQQIEEMPPEAFTCSRPPTVSSMIRTAAGVAPIGPEALMPKPVEVFTKSAPARSAIRQAAAISAGVR